MFLQSYTLKEIFEKELLFLLPIYIFLHESRFMEYNEDTVRLESLLEEYEGIKNQLEELLNAGKITEYTKCTIIDMTRKLGNRNCITRQ